ncbi:hypothetical protein SDC9_187959 [bioreactor metagenome]|uniref:Uncharacterized protein n=1 Tax=bioreactor metagenome TaxID=1076179 RepID=A0A645HPM9_9ZZZZ
MDGLGLQPAAKLTHPFGRPAGGRRQHHVQPHSLEQGHNAPDGGGLAGAGAAGQNQNSGPGRQRHGLTLLVGVGDALRLFYLRDDLVHLPTLIRVCG